MYWQRDVCRIIFTLYLRASRRRKRSGRWVARTAVVTSTDSKASHYQLHKLLNERWKTHTDARELVSAYTAHVYIRCFIPTHMLINTHIRTRALVYTSTQGHARSCMCLNSDTDVQHGSKSIPTHITTHRRQDITAITTVVTGDGCGMCSNLPNPHDGITMHAPAAP